jgi:hypothetical protein
MRETASEKLLAVESKQGLEFPRFAHVIGRRFTDIGVAGLRIPDVAPFRSHTPNSSRGDCPRSSSRANFGQVLARAGRVWFHQGFETLRQELAEGPRIIQLAGSRRAAAA